MVNVCIYGAGAIGGWMGHGLARVGCRVSVAPRGATLAAIAEHGLRLNHAGNVTAQTVLSGPSPTALGAQALVVVSVKAASIQGVARHIAPLVGPDTVVMTAMNGIPWWFLQGFGGSYANQVLRSVDPQGGIAETIAPRYVIRCVVHASCSLDEPGLVHHHFGNKLIVGEPSGQKTQRELQLADWLEQASFEAQVSGQIQTDIWFKLWGNMTVNPISALTGASTDLIMEDDLVRGFISAVMLEAKEIGARLGISIHQQPQDRHAVTRKLGAFKISMLQDVEAGKAVELDALVTAVKELSGLTNVATPNIDALVGLARLQARFRGLY